MTFRIPFEVLEPVERLIIVAKDLNNMTNEAIATALTDPPAVIAARLGIPITEVPAMPVSWSRANLANSVARAHERAWMKLALTIFGEEVLSEIRYRIVWARWSSGHGPIRAACEIGPDPD